MGGLEKEEGIEGGRERREGRRRKRERDNLAVYRVGWGGQGLKDTGS